MCIRDRAVELAAAGESGYMVTIRRTSDRPYRAEYGKIPLVEVAGKDRPFPEHWISETKTDVTDDFVRYARPLLGEDRVSVPVVGGRLRFARLKMVFAPKKLPDYVPAAWRDDA